MYYPSAGAAESAQAKWPKMQNEFCSACSFMGFLVPLSLLQCTSFSILESRTHHLRSYVAMRRHRPSQQQQGGDRREDRVDYDLQQALAMRGHHQAAADATACAARVRPSTSPGSPSSPASSKGAPRSPPASINVGVALRGLDRAEELERSGDLEQALEVYQLSLERLISYCSPSRGRGGGSRNDGPGLDREVVAERCRVALSDAERIKSKLDREKKEADAGLTGYFSSALSGWQTQGTKSPTRSTNHRQAASEEEDAGRRKKIDDTKSSSRRTSASPPTAAKINNGNRNNSSPQRRKRSNLDYANDPLVQTIKNDLYVDGSCISVKWSDVSGLDDAKRSLQEAAILPLLRPDLYTGLRSPPRGILLYGPPGTGKTMLVKAMAHESQCILFACTASALTSKWHGEGEKLVRTLFRMASDVAPSILFFDEIDALLSSRKAEGEHEASRRFKTEFMVQVDGVASGGGGGGGGGSSDGADDMQHRVLIVGCTNTPWDIDDAVMRRFQRRIYIPLPDAEARGALLRNMLKKASSDHSIKTSAQISQLIKLTEGYSCSDIAAVAQEAAFGPLRSLGGMEDIRDARTQDVRPIDLNDFEDAISKSKKSVTSGLLAKYDAWEKEQMSK